MEFNESQKEQIKSLMDGVIIPLIRKKGSKEEKLRKLMQVLETSAKTLST